RRAARRSPPPRATARRRRTRRAPLRSPGTSSRFLQVLLQTLLEPTSCAKDQAFHCLLGAGQDRRDLLVAELVGAAQDQSGPLGLGQLGEQCAEARLQLASGRDGLPAGDGAGLVCEVERPIVAVRRRRIEARRAMLRPADLVQTQILG